MIIKESCTKPWATVWAFESPRWAASHFMLCAQIEDNSVSDQLVADYDYEVRRCIMAALDAQSDNSSTHTGDLRGMSHVETEVGDFACDGSGVRGCEAVGMHFREPTHITAASDVATLGASSFSSDSSVLVNALVIHGLVALRQIMRLCGWRLCTRGSVYRLV